MPGGFKVTDYGRIEKWIRHASAGTLSDERPGSESEQRLFENQPLVRSEPHYDDIPERTPSSCDQHTNHGQVHGASSLHEPFEPAADRLGGRYFEAVRDPFVARSSEPDADHVEEIRGRIEALALHEPSEYTRTRAHNKKPEQELPERAGELKNPDPPQTANDEVIMGVIEAHDKAEDRLKELQQSCDAAQTLYNDLHRKMVEAERTGQLQGNLREEWRLYGEIVEQVDDYFLRRPDVMRYLRSAGLPASMTGSGGVRAKKEDGCVEDRGKGQKRDVCRSKEKDQEDSASEYSVESRF